MDIGSLSIELYANTSFGNNYDLNSQLGFVVLLCDKRGTAHILDYSSRKSKRVIRSILGGDADAYDREYMLKIDLELMFRIKVPLKMFTDSLQLFHVITKGSSTAERRLVIDVTATREA